MFITGVQYVLWLLISLCLPKIEFNIFTLLSPSDGVANGFNKNNFFQTDIYFRRFKVFEMKPTFFQSLSQAGFK